MEAQGTSFDAQRDLRLRLERNEVEVHGLRGEVGEIKTGQVALAAAIDRQDARIDTMVEMQRDIASKLDETRTKKTPVWAAGAGVIALFSAGVAFWTFTMTPYSAQVSSLSERQRAMEANRYTELDARTDFQRLEDEIDAEVADTRENLKDINSRILWLERNKVSRQQ